MHQSCIEHNLDETQPKENYLRNVSLAQVVSKHPAQVMQAGLAGTVCEGLQRGNAEAINAADVDDAGGIIGCGGLLQKRCDELS